MEQKTALSLSDLEEKFEKADKVTLYRTLKTFEKNKLIHSINDGSGVLKYAICNEEHEYDSEKLHVHFLCTSCNQIYCLDDVLTPQIKLPNQFELESINIIVKGVCSTCKS